MKLIAGRFAVTGLFPSEEKLFADPGSCHAARFIGDDAFHLPLPLECAEHWQYFLRDVDTNCHITGRVTEVEIVVK